MANKPDSPSRKPKRARGRPKGTGYHPTPEQRHLVKVMSGMGIPEDAMVAAIINPVSKKPINPITLRKHFRDELDQGFVQANAQVGIGLFKNATTATDTYPGGIPAAQLFWLKCRMRWQQNPERNPLPATPAQTDVIEDRRDTARRIAFLLAQEDDQARQQLTPEPGR